MENQGCNEAMAKRVEDPFHIVFSKVVKVPSEDEISRQFLENLSSKGGVAK